MKTEKFYEVHVEDEIRQYAEGTTYRQIAEEFQDRYPYDIVLVYVNGKLTQVRDDSGKCRA